MTKTLTCILCPNGCRITAREEGGTLSFEGNRCPKGPEYVRQELTAPMRTISSSVMVQGGEEPLCSVRLTAPIPKSRIFEVMDAIRSITVTAPVHTGDVLLSHVLGLESDVIATKNIDSAETP